MFIGVALLAVVDYYLGILGAVICAGIFAVKRYLWFVNQPNPLEWAKGIPGLGPVFYALGTFLQWLSAIPAFLVTFVYFLLPGLMAIFFAVLLDLTSEGLMPPIIITVKEGARAGGKAVRGAAKTAVTAPASAVGRRIPRPALGRRIKVSLAKTKRSLARSLRRLWR